MFVELAIGKLLYDTNKSLKMDAEAIAKYGKAFTKECEANQLVEQKQKLADMRMENVAKKKHSVINVSIPRFAEVYGQIQKVNIQYKSNELPIVKCDASEQKRLIQSMSLVSKKAFTDKELVVGTLLKGISGMMIEDSKRNLSAARSQMRAANVVCSQAQSICAVYDAIIERSNRIASLIVNMNSLFLGVISETKKIIDANGINVKKYSKREKETLMLCVNFAVAMINVLDIPILDENGGIAEKAVEMIETGEGYLTKINQIIAEK